MQQHAKKQGLLGELCPGEKKLEGKTFYLDGVKKHATALLLEAISFLGGRVESFLHKDVSFVVTESLEGVKQEKSTDVRGTKGTNEETKHPAKQRECVLSNNRQRPATPRPVACGSRGKALLEKAIRNNERLQVSSVLANARSWGVKILYVNDVVLYLKQLTRESVSVKHKRTEKTYNKQQSSHVKALKSPYLKIEDSSRKYKPLHMQSMTFPSLWYSGRFGPFETPHPRFEKRTEQEENKTREKKEVKSSIQNKSETPFSCNPTLWRPRKKDHSYCECCHQHFRNLEEHLQSDQHRMFVLDPSNYSVVDLLVVDMLPEFDPNPSQQSEETFNRPPTPLFIEDVCELEPLSDVETKRAVQALRRRGSFSTPISSSTPSQGPASPSPGVQLPIPITASPPIDIQSFTPEECPPHLQPNISSPAMPVLEVEPQDHNSDSQQPDNHHFSPSSESQCQFRDPYPLAPVLSPQLPFYSSSIAPHSLYSEPPILSPQWTTADEVAEGVVCEMDMAECLSESVTRSISTPLLLSMAVTNAEVKESNNGLLGFSEIRCSGSGLDCYKLGSRRSRSLPRQSPTGPNPKKRCRSVSPEDSRSKRRRITVEFSYSDSWTRQWHKPTKLENDKMAKAEDCLSDMVSCQIIQSCPNPNVSAASSTSTVETFGLTQTFSTFCVPAVEKFTQPPHQFDIVCHSSTYVADQPQIQFPNNKSHSAFSSQDSQRSLSHSTSVCIEPTLIPNFATLPPSSSDSDWDCDLLSRLGQTSAIPLSPTRQGCELDKELLHRPCTWMHDTSYESRLHTVLEPSPPAASLCGEERDSSAFSRTVVQIVKVQH
ncbi:Protein DBF4 -like protein B Activator of S phase kinase-like protein 1 [Channa argus]|uniref:Protein DBF4-like protein B Activator of S phase kinase-like protein 1 n=1 Tax=Channa argus TaxID=215402 RepID=A0A6G1QPG5_CHAAH|nr:Protein DBF4 -like protein B Activator of S phase kinase-like protein 1 [Channa argus]